jgi:tetratricopeptide (TPR) repeat protein
LENSNDTLLMQANEEELSRFEQIYQLTTEPSFFLFQYDTDIIRMACQARIDELLNPKKACVLDCSLIQTDNLLVEISKVIKENTCNLVHIINIEQAIAKYPAFLLKLNTERETIFRDLPAHIVFWTNQFVTNILQKEAFDFWSWIVFIFMLNTPVEFLTERQKGFRKKLELQDNYSFEITSKDADSRLKELERQWNIIINNTSVPPTIKELKDCFSVSKLYSNELSENADYRNAAIVLEKAIQLIENTTLTNELNIIFNELGLVYRDLGDLKDAKLLLEKALEDEIKTLGEMHPRVAICQSNLAMIHQDLGNLVEAKDLLEKALKSDINNFGLFNPTVAIGQSNLALVYKDLGNLQEAKGLLEKALESDVKNFGVMHPKVANRQSNLALIYKDLGNLKESEDLLKKALKSDIKNFGELHPTVSTRQSNLAAVYQDMGKLESAKEFSEKALKTEIKIFGILHHLVAIRQSNLALVYEDLGNYKEAKDLLEKAYLTSKKVLGENTTQTKSIKENLDNVLNHIKEIKKK